MSIEVNAYHTPQGTITVIDSAHGLLIFGPEYPTRPNAELVGINAAVEMGQTVKFILSNDRAVKRSFETVSTRAFDEIIVIQATDIPLTGQGEGLHVYGYPADLDEDNKHIYRFSLPAGSPESAEEPTEKPAYKQCAAVIRVEASGDGTGEVISAGRTQGYLYNPGGMPILDSFQRPLASVRGRRNLRD